MKYLQVFAFYLLAPPVHGGYLTGQLGLLRGEVPVDEKPLKEYINFRELSGKDSFKSFALKVGSDKKNPRAVLNIELDNYRVLSYELVDHLGGIVADGHYNLSRLEYGSQIKIVEKSIPRGYGSSEIYFISLFYDMDDDVK